MVKVEERDRNLISGVFLEDDIDPSKFWISKYFTSAIQKRFLIYFLIFRSHYYFSRHTGIVCTERYLKKMKKKLSILEEFHKKAKNDFDIEMLSKIEMGEFEIN